MAKVLATVQAIITRLVFACHGFVAIWQVTYFKKDPKYWYLAGPTLLLFFEGVFTLTIKENQEWKWFCPSVFIYLWSVVPAIWLLELEKVTQRINNKDILNTTSLDYEMLGTRLNVPTNTWITLIEQFLMLTLIVGRWLLPKGDLTRDQLSQLLLVYIGTAADIIEFFDSYKVESIAKEQLLVYLTLGIWSWSLIQFTIVLSANKTRKSTTDHSDSGSTSSCCCTVDICAIIMNIVLQDAPFLAFRLLLITHYSVVSYMNVFFTCKNTLVILLQLYRLYVIHAETNEIKQNTRRHRHRHRNKHKKIREKVKGKHRKKRDANIAIISDLKDQCIDTNKIRAIILTSKRDLNKLEKSKLFNDLVTLERVHESRPRGKALKQSESSGQNAVRDTDDSGI